MGPPSARMNPTERDNKCDVRTIEAHGTSQDAGVQPTWRAQRGKSYADREGKEERRKDSACSQSGKRRGAT